MSMTKKLALTLLAVAAVLFLSGKVLAASADDEIKVRRVEMATNTLTVRVNQERMLYAGVIPRNADEPMLTWSTSNPEVAQVDQDGIVTGISPGQAEITAATNSGKKDTCLVTVPGKATTGFDLQTSNKENPEAEVNAGERLSASTLRLDAENAVKAAANNKGTLTYTGKTVTSTTALRSAAFSAEYQGGEVTLRFRTAGEGGSMQGQLSLNPKNTPTDGDDDVKLGVYTQDDKVESMRQSADKHFGKKTAVVRLSQSSAFGMKVQVAAKADLAGINTQKLKIYRYNGEYTLLENPAAYVDDNGYIYFTVTHGGYYVITS